MLLVQAAAAQEAIEAAVAQPEGKSRRVRKPSAKQEAAAQQALEEAAERERGAQVGADVGLPAAAPDVTTEQPPAHEAAAPADVAAGLAGEEAYADDPAAAAAAAEPQQHMPQHHMQDMQAELDAGAALETVNPQEAAAAAAVTADPNAVMDQNHPHAAAALHLQHGAPDALQQQLLHEQQQAAQQQQHVEQQAGQHLEDQLQHQVDAQQAAASAAAAAQQQQMHQQQPTAEEQQLYAQQQADAETAAAHAQAAAAEQDDQTLLAAVVAGTAVGLGIALVVPDEQGTEHHHEPVPIHLMPHSTVADLKRRIERTNLHGQSFSAAQQDLQLVTAENMAVPLEEYTPDGSHQGLDAYGLTSGAGAGGPPPTIYLRIKPVDPNAILAQQGEVQLNPDGSEKKKRRPHNRWKEEDVLKLIAGVEQLGVGHWRQMQREFDLGHRTDVDLKDKWRNITKAVAQNKKMRGSKMEQDMLIRVQNCMRIAQERKEAKAAGEAAQQAVQAVEDPGPEAVAQQAAAEDGTVQGVLDGALHQQEGDVHVDVGDLDPNQVQYHQPPLHEQQPQQHEPHAQLQEHDALQPQEQHQELNVDVVDQQDPNVAQPEQQQQPQPQYQAEVAAAAAGGDGDQALNDPGAVVIPVPGYEDDGGGGEAPPMSDIELPGPAPLVL